MQFIWILNLIFFHILPGEQNSSSDPSVQSSLPSHCHLVGIQWWFRQRKPLHFSVTLSEKHFNYFKSIKIDLKLDKLYLPHLISSEPSSQSFSPSQCHLSGMQCLSDVHSNWLLRHSFGVSGFSEDKVVKNLF